MVVEMVFDRSIQVSLALGRRNFGVVEVIGKGFVDSVEHIASCQGGSGAFVIEYKLDPPPKIIPTPPSRSLHPLSNPHPSLKPLFSQPPCITHRSKYPNSPSLNPIPGIQYIGRVSREGGYGFVVIGWIVGTVIEGSRRERGHSGRDSAAGSAWD